MVALDQEVSVISTRLKVSAFSVLRTLVIAVPLAAGLAACAPTPAEEARAGERLDSNTGTTVTLMPKPVELIVDRDHGQKTDPFAYLAPFETNRMGAHELYLWVSAPQVEGPLGIPQVYCGRGSRSSSIPRAEHVKEMGLSGPPYKLPAPWSVQWYFKLSGEVLDCLAARRKTADRHHRTAKPSLIASAPTRRPSPAWAISRSECGRSASSRSSVPTSSTFGTTISVPARISLKSTSGLYCWSSHIGSRW